MKELAHMPYNDTHVYFWKNKTPFSNFYHAPFQYKGHTLLFSEQGFMLEKALLFDPSKVDAIVAASAQKKLNAWGVKFKTTVKTSGGPNVIRLW